jgi:N-acetyl-anhydromuramyl-L-alanine amidase AmpD
VSWLKRDETNYIVIHCSMTMPGVNLGVKDLDRSGRAKMRLDSGYHYVIRKDGGLDYGRPRDTVGQHCVSVDDESVGVCLVGGMDDDGLPASTFTHAQFETLRMLIDGLLMEYPDAEVVEHGDVEDTGCPHVDIQNEL